MSVIAVLISSDKATSQAVRAAARTVRGCQIDVYPDFEVGLGQLRRADVGLAICHVRSEPDFACAQILLQELMQARRPLATVVINDSPHPEWELRLLQAGAVDCFSRPLDVNRLRFLIDSLTLRSRYEFVLRPKTRLTSTAVGSNAGLPPVRPLACTSPRMQDLLRQAEAVADRDCAVLFTGETGTGKTRLARYVHDASPRWAAPFVHVDCAAIPENLIESELFGHRRGAFTGAVTDQSGKCAAADGGTLFLDEIDALVPAAQSRLLRLVDERVYEPVGSCSALPLGARIIAATNKDLGAEVAAGRFRQDLYYRLNVIELAIPPLRDRREEVRPLAETFLADSVRRNNLPDLAVDQSVWHVLAHYDWPGNIRELRNVIDRASVLCSQGVIRMEDLPDRIVEVTAGSSGTIASAACRIDPLHSLAADSEPSSIAVDGEPTDSGILRRFPSLSQLAVGRMRGEMRKILQVLQSTDNNRSAAARQLGISREALYKKMRKYGLMEYGAE